MDIFNKIFYGPSQHTNIIQRPSEEIIQISDLDNILFLFAKFL